MDTLYKIRVSQGTGINFTIPEEKREKWLSSVELKGAIRLAEKLNQHAIRPMLLIKILDSKLELSK